MFFSRFVPGFLVVLILCSAPSSFALVDQESFKEPVFLYACTGYSQDSRFNMPKGIFFDPHRREVYVADSGNHQIVVFDSAGTPLGHFPHYVKDASGELSRLGEPKSVAVDSAGRIFVTDALSTDLDVLDFRGELLGVVDVSQKLGGTRARAEIVTVDAEGNIYVGTSGDTAGIAKFNSELELVSFFPVPLTTEDRDVITSLWVDATGKLYVSHATGTPCVRVLSPTGEAIVGFGDHDAGWENFSFPGGVVTTSGGMIWVADPIRQLVTCFNPDGTFAGKFGGLGGRAGDLTFPVAVAGDGKERLFVLESIGARYQAFLARVLVDGGAQQQAGNRTY